jgi:hypothetical protein
MMESIVAARRARSRPGGAAGADAHAFSATSAKTGSRVRTISRRVNPFGP